MLNELAKEIHKNAIAHGWREEERSFGEIIALCHSELSEALEEYRDGKPMVYYNCCESEKHPCLPKNEDECLNYGKESVCKYRGRKPEGIAAELADCIIRILDYCGKEKSDAENYATLPIKFRPTTSNFGEWINYLHATLSACVIEQTSLYMGGCIKEIYQYCGMVGIDIDAVIRTKHEYNKTRPYRHGGKVI